MAGLSRNVFTSFHDGAPVLQQDERSFRFFSALVKKKERARDLRYLRWKICLEKAWLNVCMEDVLRKILFSMYKKENTKHG